MSTPPHGWAHVVADGIVLCALIQPKATRTQCAGFHDGAVKIRVAASPVDGAANEALVRYLAKQVGLPVHAVEIQSGASSRRKRILLRGATISSVKEALGL